MDCLTVKPSEIGRRLPKFRILQLLGDTPQSLRRERDCFLLYYTKKGYVTLSGEGVDLRLGYGSIAILPPDIAHTVTFNTAGAEVSACAFTIGFVETILQNQAGSGGTLSRLFNAGECMLVSPVPADTQIHLQHLMDFMLHEYRADRLLAEHAIRNCLATVLCVFSELYQEQLAAPEMREKNSIVYAIHYIKTNYQKPLGLDDVAHLTRMTRKDFCHRFKKFSGMTFHSFLSKTRIEAAMKILKEAEEGLSLTTLAELSGYESYVTFYRNFVKQVGMPPADYLAAMRAEGAKDQ